MLACGGCERALVPWLRWCRSIQVCVMGGLVFVWGIMCDYYGMRWEDLININSNINININHNSNINNNNNINRNNNNNNINNNNKTATVRRNLNPNRLISPCSQTSTQNQQILNSQILKFPSPYIKASTSPSTSIPKPRDPTMMMMMTSKINNKPCIAL